MHMHCGAGWRIRDARFLTLHVIIWTSRRYLRPLYHGVAVITLAVIAIATSHPAAANHPDDSCPDTHVNEGESLDFEITVKDTGQVVSDGMILPTGTPIRIHARATAYGRCDVYFAVGYCDGPHTYQRNVIIIKELVTTKDYTRDYQGGVAPYAYHGSHVVDSHDSANTTGPINSTVKEGFNLIEMVNAIGDTPCQITPNRVIKPITIYGHTYWYDENLGCAKGGTGVGNPCDVSKGNKYQKEVDSTTAILPLERHYNSQLKVDFGLGYGWLTPYHRRLERLISATGDVIRVRRADGSSEPFTKSGGVWQGESDSAMTLTEDATGFTVRHSDRSSNRYDLNGRLISETDNNGRVNTLSYDSLTGRLAQVSDAYGHMLTFAYDANGRVASITGPDGGQFVYGYDAKGNLTQVTYPDSTIRKYLYEDTTNIYSLTGIEDPGAIRFATFAYNSSGKVTSSEHAGGAERVTLNYVSSLSTSVTDALNTARTFNFSYIKGMYRTTSISGTSCNWCPAPKTTTYDANGNPFTKTDFNGIQTRYTYDLARNLETSRTEAYGTPRARTITTTWHPTYRLPDVITEPNRTIDYDYYTNGSLFTKTITDTSVTPNASRVWTWTYDTDGRIATEDGPRTDVSDVTTYAYYSCTTGYQCGQLQTMTNALGQITTYNTYNAYGQPLTIIDPNNVVTTLTYDARQRLTSRQVGTENTTFEYWPTGLLKKVTLPDTSFLLYTYDDARRLIKIEDGEGNRIEYTLDAMGNRTAENVYDLSSALARTRTQVFNSLNQLWKQIGAAGTPAVTTVFGYDNNGNQTTINAPLSRNTINQYDELNRLKQITDPASGVTQLGYDANDNLTSVTDPRGKVTSYQYTGFGDLKQLTSPDTGTAMSTFDSGGNLATRTDARSKTGTHSYDALNRVTQIAYPDQTIAFTYDAGTNGKGRLTGASDANHSMSWTYDAHGRVTGKGQTVGAITKSVGYGYSNGNLASLVTPSGQTITYGYTAGRITSVTLNASTTILNQVLYEPFGPVRGWTWGNGTLADRTYDLDGKASALDSAGAYTYAYDDAFRITGITDLADSAKSWTYGYDALDRLNAASKTSQTIGWTYDTNGNRLTQTGTTTATYTISSTNNRVTSITGTPARTYSYDAAGNVTGYGSLTFTYSDAGRLSSVTNAGTTTSYILNVLGQRVKKSNSSSTRFFVYDEAGHLIGEYDGSGVLVQETVWLGDIPVATLRPDGSGGVNVFYVHTNHLNTPRRISRPSDNAIVWRWDSDPFGMDAANEDTDGDSTLFAYNLRFPGQYYDAETGLHQNYMRDYDPATGRYVESDPIGLKGGANTYVYALNDPIRKFDSNGLMACDGTWRSQGWSPILPRILRACVCYWLCMPCEGAVMWSGVRESLPTTRGPIIFIPGRPSSEGDIEEGNACACKKPGPEKDCSCVKPRDVDGGRK